MSIVSHKYRGAKGSTFERNFKAFLKSKRFHVVRQPKSAFPDIVAIPPRIGTTTLESGSVLHESYQWQRPMFIECKVGKYISAKEKDALELLRRQYNVIVGVCYPKYGAHSKKEDNFIVEKRSGLHI